MRRFMRLVEGYGYGDEDDGWDDPDAPWGQRWKATRALPAGTILFHGTDQRFHSSQIEGPAWFSTERKVAEHFAKRQGKRGKVLRYSLRESLTLPVIRSRDEFDDFAEMFAIDSRGTEDMRDSMLRSRLPGWIIPDNYAPGDDILICDLRILESA